MYAVKAFTGLGVINIRGGFRRHRDACKFLHGIKTHRHTPIMFIGVDDPPDVIASLDMLRRRGIL